MNMRTRTLLGVALAAIAMTACGSDEDGDAGSPDGEWIAVSGVSDGSAVELIEGFAVTIGIDGDQVVGTAACNRYSGQVTTDRGGSFRASDLSWTEIGCESAVLEVERSYLTSLDEFTNYAVSDDVLTLSGSSDEWVFEPSPDGG